jgi:hypothetical protein
MRRAAATIGLAASLLVAAPLAVTSAQAAGSRTDAYPAGPYTVTVTREDPVSVDHRTEFAVGLSPADSAGLVAIPFPGAGTDARPGRAATVARRRPGTYLVSVSFPVRGAWVLALAVAGPAGRGQAAVPVTVAAPGAIPQWLGWAIGLSPLAGLAVFLAVQVRAARRLRSVHLEARRL